MLLCVLRSSEGVNVGRFSFELRRLAYLRVARIRAPIVSDAITDGESKGLESVDALHPKVNRGRGDRPST